MTARKRVSHPAVIAAFVALVYVGQALWAVEHPRRFDYVLMDYADAYRSHSSLTIDRAVAAGPVHRDGYDGQFFFFIALDPRGAGPYLDNPAYRYGRIGYPLIARAVALGRRQWIRASLVLVNALSIAASVFFAGLILARWRTSAWWSLLLATYPGLMFFAFVRDTSEPLACALSLAAVWWLVRVEDRIAPMVAAGVGTVFAAAALVRETSLLFALAAVIVVALRKKTATAAVLAAVSTIPLLAWKTFLAFHFGELGSGGVIDSPIPLNGVFAVRPWNSDERLAILSVVLPAIVLIVLAGRALGARSSILGPLLVLTNAVPFLFLGPSVFDGYGSAGRVATGIAASVVLCLPAIRDVWGSRTRLVAAALWSMPFWLVMAAVAS